MTDHERILRTSCGVLNKYLPGPPCGPEDVPGKIQDLIDAIVEMHKLYEHYEHIYSCDVQDWRGLVPCKSNSEIVRSVIAVRYGKIGK